MGKGDDLPRGCHDFQRSGDRGELILGASRPFDHPCGYAEGDGVGRDILGHKTEGSYDGILSDRHSGHDNTVAAHLAVLS